MNVIPSMRHGKSSSNDPSPIINCLIYHSHSFPWAIVPMCPRHSVPLDVNWQQGWCNWVQCHFVILGMEMMVHRGVFADLDVWLEKDFLPRIVGTVAQNGNIGASTNISSVSNGSSARLPQSLYLIQVKRRMIKLPKMERK